MVDFLKNIIPRIKMYSRDLSKVENFVDKNWVFIDEKGSKHEYLFLRDKRIIMTLDSVTKEGSWDLLPTGDLLIKRSSDDLVKLGNLFVEDALLILKQSATDNLPFILINQELIPDLDVVAYLERYEEKQEEKELPRWEHKYKLLKNGEIDGPSFSNGKEITTYDNSVLSGTYKTSVEDCEQYVVIKNNTIKNVYYLEKYRYGKTTIVIKQEDLANPRGGILINNEMVVPYNQKFVVVNRHGDRCWIKVSPLNRIVFFMDSFTRTIIISVIVIIFFAFVIFLFSTLK